MDFYEFLSRLVSYIPHLATIATFITALTTWLTVRQMALQRRATYKPSLVLKGKPFRLFKSDSSHCSYRNWESSATDSQSAIVSTKGPHTLDLELLNLGMGAAVDVKLTWSFNVEAFMERVNEIAKARSMDVKATCKGGMLFVNMKEGAAAYTGSSPITAQFDFLQLESSLKVFLPAPYLKLLEVFYHCCFEGLNEPDFKLEVLDFDNVPPLKLNVTYTDIGGEHYDIDIIIEPSLVSGSMTEINGYFSAKKLF